MADKKDCTFMAGDEMAAMGYFFYLGFEDIADRPAR
jgi:hypothetical protein